MNKNFQLRSDLYCEDKLVQHDLRVMAASPDESDPSLLRLVLEDAYGSFAAIHRPVKPIDLHALPGEVFQAWGYPIDHENPEHGLDISFLEPKENADPSLVLVPISACAPPAVAALHAMIDIVDVMQSRAVAAFVGRVLGADQIYPHFFKAKAAPFSHHSYEGGLAVHSADAAAIVASLDSTHFSSNLGRDLAIAAALLHDLGKAAWAGADYVNPMVLHESRSLVLAAGALNQLRQETDSATADMALFLMSKESRVENGSCPEAVAVAMADRLSATRDGQILAFKRCRDYTLTASRLSGSYAKRYIRVVDDYKAKVANAPSNSKPSRAPDQESPENDRIILLKLDPTDP